MKIIYTSKPLLSFTFIIAALTSLISCQRVIDVDLISTDPQIVIEGSITDQKGPYTVKISRTVNFKETNNFPRVTGATVVISDNAENSEILTESSPGVYTTSSIQGVPGRTYTMSVKVNEKEYIGVSKMPFPVEITDLAVRQSDFGRDKVVDVFFTDAPEIENYYRFIQIINGSQQKEIDIFDDELNNGNELSYTLFTDDEDVDLHQGDSIVVFLQSIDKTSYEFYRTIRQAMGGSQSPANPNSNLSNGALGFFTAYSVTSDTIVVE